MPEMMNVSVLNCSSISFSSHGKVHAGVALEVGLWDGLTRPKSVSTCGGWSSADSWDGCCFFWLAWDEYDWWCLGDAVLWPFVAGGRGWRCFWRSTCSGDSLRSTLTHPVNVRHDCLFLHGLDIQGLFLYSFGWMVTLRPIGVAREVTRPGGGQTQTLDLGQISSGHVCKQ